MPPTKTWKSKERSLADLFGTKRRPLSGGNQNQGNARDDAQHPHLFIESKYSMRHAIWTLWRHCKNCCRKEMRFPKRVPVIGLYAKGEPDKCLLVIHEDDLFRVTAARLDALIDEMPLGVYRTLSENLLRLLHLFIKQQ